uniref:Uncharacterized protein n=1 Tax=Panagrolaimus sp. PS1159 TaxID=55785 RepID=A0AC35GUX6_9BILA
MFGHFGVSDILHFFPSAFFFEEAQIEIKMASKLALITLALACCISSGNAQAAAWPATSYSPYFEQLFRAASSPVAAAPSGPGMQAPAIPIPAPIPVPVPQPVPVAAPYAVPAMPVAFAPPPPPPVFAAPPPPPPPMFAPAFAVPAVPAVPSYNPPPPPSPAIPPIL